LTLEQLAREPHVVLKRVYEYLEIEPLIPDQISPESSVSLPRSSHTRSSHKRLYQFSRALRRVAVLRPLATIAIPKVVREHIYDIAKIQEGRFRLNKDEESAITAMLKPDLMRLRDRYGIDAEKEWGIHL